ncbi:MAG TPA: redoxin domain-containing protein [Lacibacter sp.]|nr:redoxin domain-containing protein [Lacibacter sp.]HMO89384.1 redoxin domain-containing protein [Lacibacter sp.]HMP86621.1 redoxin domain-containing protein [Lacibacter sp.]
MRHLLFICLLAAPLLPVLSAPLTRDSIPAHLQGLPLPDFKLELPDGSAFYTDNLPKNKPVVIILFSPDCDHCREQTRELVDQIHRLRQVQLVMATVLPHDKMKAFYQEFGIGKHRNIVMGRDPLFFFSRYFQSHYIPFTAVYNKKRELVATFDGGVKMEQLLGQLQ